MSASRVGALSYLAWRALVAHPLKRLAQRGTGAERFVASYAGEGLVPTRPEDRAIGEAASACIGCGLCDAGCALSGAAASVRDLGLRAAFRLYSRGTAELPLARAALEACAACPGCDPLCPTGVPITRIVRHLLSRLSPGYNPPPGPL